jgi:mannose-6-phosphate isomerase
MLAPEAEAKTTLDPDAFVTSTTTTYPRRGVRPEPVQPTRVYRFYRGGELIGRLRNEPEIDGDYPEDWLASATHASNPGRGDSTAGLSRLSDGRLLRDAINAAPDEWLGTKHVQQFGTSPGILVKLLDAAVRLPVHAHPSRTFANEHFGSPFGKTEAWIVLGTRREEAEVWLGLRKSVAPATYRGWIEQQDVKALLDSLRRLSVRAGDVLFVPAGVPHAIGAGVLIAEVQEPTDLSLVCEWKGFPIAQEDSHLGIGWDVAVGALRLDAYAAPLGLPDEARQFFQVDDVPEPANRFGVLLIIRGEGEIDGKCARSGDAFALPASCTSFEVSGDVSVLRFLAPEK